MLRAVKIFHVVRHNIGASRRKSQFQKHVIVRVCEKWPPKEMDFLQMGLAGKVAQKAAGIFRRVAGRQILGACQHFLPLGIKPHREAKLELRRRNGTDQREARTSPGSGGCHQNTGVDHNFHLAESSTILISSGVRLYRR